MPTQQATVTCVETAAAARATGTVPDELLEVLMWAEEHESGPVVKIFQDVIVNAFSEVADPGFVNGNEAIAALIGYRAGRAAGGR